MATIDVIAHIDAEIALLQETRAVLTGSPTAPAAGVKSGRGRPKGSKNATKVPSVAAAPAKKSTKRKLSPEGRKAIAEAMKRRWAERKKQTVK